MRIPLLIIGGGLSGLAAAIRFARFDPDVLILEKHSRVGGLNSWYYRHNTLFETGLHAITNFARPGDKNAPLNRLFRQLKLRRTDFTFREQRTSEICFINRESLLFSNDFNLLLHEVTSKFPASADQFLHLVQAIREHDPFQPTPFRSARAFLTDSLNDPLLVEMLLCPLMYYGSSVENDMDFNQFVIMFRAIFLEGMFRPQGSIRDLLEHLLHHYQSFGGQLRLQAPVNRILRQNHRVQGVELVDGEVIQCDLLLSTIGLEETLALLDPPLPVRSGKQHGARLGFVESIFCLPTHCPHGLPENRTIIFYNQGARFSYQRPQTPVDFSSGVICLPANFQGLEPQAQQEVRTTHLADYRSWKALAADKDAYIAAKRQAARESGATVAKIIGNFTPHTVYQDTFTPLTIERFTAKKEGAIYGCPDKIKDGDIGFDNLFLAGTDQGFLGIVGSMLSGVSMVNRHLLSRLS